VCVSRRDHEKKGFLFATNAKSHLVIFYTFVIFLFKRHITILNFEFLLKAKKKITACRDVLLNAPAKCTLLFEYDDSFRVQINLYLSIHYNKRVYL